MNKSAASTPASAAKSQNSLAQLQVSGPAQDDLANSASTRMEHSLRACEERLRLVLELTRAGIWEVDSRSGRVSIDQKTIEALGYSPAEVPQTVKDWSGFEHPEDKARVSAALEALLRGEIDRFCIEKRSRRKDGGWTWSDSRACVAERTADGVPLRIIGTHIEINERKQAEEALRQSERNYREIYNSANDAIFVHDPKTGNVLDVNESMLRLYGYSREEALRLTLEDLGAAPHSEVEARRWIARAETGEAQVFEWRARKKSGQPFWAEVGLRNAEISGQRRVLAVVRDITERKEAEERIRQQAALLDVSHDAVLVWEVENGVQFMNLAAEQLTGMPLGQGINKPLGLLLRARSEVELQAAMREVIANGNWTGELTLLAADEAPRVVSSRWTLLPNPEGKAASVLITCNDITEKKKLESQYLRIQRLESVGTLASGVAHDLNNILSPVLMGIELLEEKLAKDDEGCGILKMMKDSARRGADTIKQLLTFARGTEAQKGPVQPLHLLKEIVRLLQQTLPKNIQIYTDYSQRTAPVLADPSQLHQVLMNLCVNARDAMPDGGVLFVKLENRRLDVASARIHPKARPQAYVVFKVSDSGIGIAPEILDRIFDPFFTTKPLGKGTGLGLSTVLGIVEDHGGFVLVESKLGRGASFEVFLPASAGGEEAEAGREPLNLPCGHGEMVLLVDDELPILQLAGEILLHGGYRVITASNASEALHLYERNYDKIRAVLTDIMMPFGDGRQLITMLYEHDPKLPVIAMSGLATKEFQRETMLRGARAFIRKPFSTDELLRVLADLLGPGQVEVRAQAVALPPPRPAPGSTVRPDSRPIQNRIILLVENDPEARQTVGQALRVLGYGVYDAPDAQQALVLWQKHRGQIDLLLTGMQIGAGYSGLRLVEHLKALKPSLKAILSTEQMTEAEPDKFGNRLDMLQLAKPYTIKQLAELVDGLWKNET
jgi:PAS domain S-box-containing protein